MNEAMKTIDQDVPAGKTLEAGPLRFVGPAHAKARIARGATVRLVDTPPSAPPMTAAQRRRRTARIELRRLEADMPSHLEDLIAGMLAAGTMKLADLIPRQREHYLAKQAARAELNK